ncbi:hypothetical protein V6N13_089136 [Hibiscus sabdariffa]|uniref:DUF632 domain-containing protein n=1 Tax=Hibiscus sabdariffa TaxID=183260 RepID=A0ABR1ZS05_9ROSI
MSLFDSLQLSHDLGLCWNQGYNKKFMVQDLSLSLLRKDEPHERLKNRYPFSPHRYLGFRPPIFVLCREWSAGIKALPAEELSVAIKAFLSDICHLMNQQADQLQKDQSVDANNGESDSKDGRNALTDGDTNDDISSNLSCIQASLTHVLDRLNKFSEAL